MKQKVKRIVHKLRSKPEEEKRHLVRIFTFIGAINLIILWSWSLGTNFSDPDTKVKMKQDLKPFSVLKDNMVGNYNNVPNVDANNNQ